MVGAVVLRRQIIDRVAFIFGVGRDDVDTNLWVLGFEFWDVFDFDGKVDSVKVECALVLDVVGNALGVDLGWVQTTEDRPLKATLVFILNIDDSVLLGYGRWGGHVTVSCKGSILRNNESEITDHVERKAATTFGKVFDAIQKIAE